MNGLAGLTSGQEADMMTARLLNLRTPWDNDAWWQPIVLHNRRIRAEKEAKIVRERFGDVGLIDQLTKEHLAYLINSEMMDVFHFESHAAPMDDRGNHPSVGMLQAMRKARTDQAILDALAERWRRANMHLIPAATHDGTNAEDQSSIMRQQLTVSETMIVDTESSTSREGAMLGPTAAHESTETQASQASRGITTRDTANISQASRRANSVTLGREDTKSDPAIARSDTVIASPDAQGYYSTQGNTPTTPDAPPTIQEGLLNPSQAVPSVRTATPNGIILESRPIQPSVCSGSSHGKLRAHTASTYPQGSHLVDHSVDAWPQGLEPPLAGPNSAALPSGWNRMKWAYRTHTVADLELQKHGIWLYDRPPTFHEITPPIRYHDKVVVAPHCLSEYTTTLISDGQTLVLFPRPSPRQPDLRSTDNIDAVTPDNIFGTRLTEYQSLESLGYEVWRHDRKYLPCSNPTCGKVLSDQVKSTLICLGCGPKTTIRYCSRACQTTDSYRHGQDCGLRLHLIRSIIDPGTAPPRFSHLFPAIRSCRHGIRTYETYRQRLHAQTASNRYTLFDPRTGGRPTTLVWDLRFRDDGAAETPYRGYAAEMEARIERCLNIALLDQSQSMVLGYLFRLLQQCLRLKANATPTVARVLADQFALEFGFHASASASWRCAAAAAGEDDEEEEVCECEWAGDDVVDPRGHVQACRERWRRRGRVVVGEVFRGQKRCLRGLVEGLEARYW
ncbi:MAG: hypothetical protein Q9177_005846, partial [Variospora cf. flavescens]